MTGVSSNWKVAEPVPVTVWRLIEFPLWCLDFVLAFKASRHSSSNQGFDFLGIVVALGMLSFPALVICLTKECSLRHSCYNAHSRSIWSMVSVWPQWWQPVGGPRDKIWDLVALVWPIRRRVITTSSALVRCWNFFGGPSVVFTRYSYLPCTATSHLIWTNFWM